MLLSVGLRTSAALAACTLLLSGCIPAPSPLPERASDEEVARVMTQWHTSVVYDGDVAPADEIDADFTFQRFIDDPDEHQEAMQACLGQFEGLNITVTRDGGVHWEGGAEDEAQRLSRVVSGCFSMYPPSNMREQVLSVRER